MPRIDIAVCGLSLVVDYEYEPAQRQTRDDPSWPESADAYAVYLEGKVDEDFDLFEVLSTNVIDKINEAILVKLSEERRYERDY